MLLELSIQDLALIERAELALDEGLNVITGETGAGKSLLVASIELLLGQTPRGGAKQWVRSGAKEARVEGRFSMPDSDVARRVAGYLDRELPALTDAFSELLEAGEPELILTRTLGADGKTRAYVDQRPVTLKALRGLAPLLVEIHGQNEHQRLLDTGEQLRLVDAFGALEKPLARYREARDGWLELVARERALEAARDDRRDRLDLLRFQRDELTEAELSPGEHAQLAEERDLLRNAGDLTRDLGGYVHAFRDSDDAIVARLTSAENTLARWAELVPSLQSGLEDLREARLHLDEAAATLGSVLDGVENDPARLEVVEERLAELERLEDKYRTDEAGLVERCSQVNEEVEELEAAEEGLGDLRAEIEVAQGSVERAAAGLTKKRAALASKLSKAVEKSLAALGLEKASFELSFESRNGSAEERFGPHGAEGVEFLLAANPGEPSGPLRRVASGGEMARIMLALRTVLSACDRGRTLIFDEIDSGVGGRLGPEVAAHLREVAGHHQVLCVTHLPAIAAQAHVHLHASKEVQGKRTRTAVDRLSGDARVAEVADMIAGGSAHESARAEARRLLKAK